MLIRFLSSLVCASCVFAAPLSAQTKKALAEREELFKTPRVLEIVIDLDKKELDALRQAPRTYAKATLKVGGKIYPNVGIHIKGAAGSYRGIDDKPGLTINMNKFAEETLFFGMDKFHLANSVQDPSYVSELICGDLFRAAGVPAARVSHALVTINGRKRGVYYLKEGYDKYFLRHHFKNADGNFYDGGFLRDVDQALQLVSSRDDVKDRSDLKALAAAARDANPQLRMQKLEKILDMDKFISYLVLESVTWDWDGYPMNRNNYRIYHDKQRDRLVFIPSGMDQMFGNPGGPMLPGFQGFVAQAVVGSPEGRTRYYLRMADIHEEILDVEKISKRLAELQAVVQPALMSVDQGAGHDFPNQINRLRQLIAQRAKSLEQQLQVKLADMRIQFSPPGEFFGGKNLEINNIRYLPEKRDAKTAGKLFWRSKGESKFAELPLEALAKNRFKATLPALVTKGPFEYFLEMQEAGGKPMREPTKGDQSPLLAIPDLTPPTIVPDLAANVVKSYRVALAWKPATDDRRVAGYRVYRGMSAMFVANEKTLLATLPAEALTYADDKPQAKQTSWYAVQAVDAVGREGEVRYLQLAVPDHQPPANTVKLLALPSTKAVMVTWSGELEPIVNAMEIYRGEGKDGLLKKIGEITEIKKARYLDKDTKFGVEYRYQIRPRSTVGLVGEAGGIVSASPLRYLKRINCGGPEIAAEDGVPWEADAGDGHPSVKYSGSRVWHIVDSPTKDIYQSERWANVGLGYAFKLDPGRYEVVLHFAETNPDFAGKGKRLFDIVINGKVVAEKVDVFTESGGASKPWQFRKIVELKDGELEIKLMANPTGPAIKAFEIRGLPPG